MDDGPIHLRSSLEMASIAADDGIRTIIATPHTDGIRVNRTSVLAAVTQLNQELVSEGIQVEIIPGFEIPYHLVKELAETHTLGSSNHVLIEFHHRFVPGDALSTLHKLLDKNFQPIIAHPERNMQILENPDRLDDFINAGALLQLTASSITGDMGPDILQCSHLLLQKGYVHFIATDSHSPSFREPVLSKAYKTVTKINGRAMADRIFMQNASSIIHPGINKDVHLDE